MYYESKKDPCSQLGFVGICNIVLRHTAVHQLDEYEQNNPFSCFQKEVKNPRREADKIP